MKAITRSVAINGRTPLEIFVTASRGITPTEPDDLGLDHRLARERSFAEIFKDLDIPTDGWTISSTPQRETPTLPTETTTAALAAVLIASGAAAADRFPADAIMNGVWSTRPFHADHPMPFSVRGAAIAAHWAAENNRLWVSASHGPGPALWPRTLPLKYSRVGCIEELTRLLNGQAEIHEHQPLALSHEPPSLDTSEHRYLLEDANGIFGHLLPMITAAVVERMPLLLMLPDGAGPGAAYAAILVGRIATLLAPPLTAVEQQLVLETYDLTGMAPPGGLDGPTSLTKPIPRPRRGPHWSTRADALASLDNYRTPRDDNPSRPRELDLAAHGILSIEDSPGRRFDREAAETVADDFRNRTEGRYLLFATTTGTPSEVASRSERNYPLTTVFPIVEAWPETRPRTSTGDRADAYARNLELLKEAQEHVRGEWARRRPTDPVEQRQQPQEDSEIRPARRPHTSTNTPGHDDNTTTTTDPARSDRPGQPGVPPQRPPRSQPGRHAPHRTATVTVRPAATVTVSPTMSGVGAAPDADLAASARDHDAAAG
jgi:hypothetical protein